jgi:hypothetical protein
MFIGFMVIFLLLGIDPFLSALFSAVLGLAISLLFLHKQRDSISTAIYNRNQKKSSGDSVEADIENDLLDDHTKKNK